MNFLYSHFPPFRRWVDSLITTKLTTYDDKDSLELAFILDDQKYYRYTNEFKIPIDRQGQIQDHLTAMSAMLSGPEVELIIDVFEKNLEKLLNSVNGKLRLESISKLGFVVKEIKGRKKNLLHPDIFNQLVATVYLREDEIGQPYSQKVHNQKLEALEEAKKKGLFDPFGLKGLDSYIPLLKDMPSELKEYLNQQEPQVRAWQKTLKELTSVTG